MLEELSSIVFVSRSRAECAERQLVLQSRGIESEIVAAESGFALIANSRDAQSARAELATYAEENRDFVPRPIVREPDYYPAAPGLIGYVVTLWVVAIAAEFTLFGIDWYGAGRIDSGSLFDGQWYRAATALTLHSDLGHITANLGFGLALGYFASRYFGYGLASAVIFASGVIGNVMNALVRGPGHFSVGASTAIFGALGLIGVYAWRKRLYPQQSWPQRLGPVIGALALLAYTGAGGERTDVGAHFWGFIAGAGFGWLLAASHSLRRDPRAQRAYAGLALVALTACWMVALVNAQSPAVQ